MFFQNLFRDTISFVFLGHLICVFRVCRSNTPHEVTGGARDIPGFKNYVICWGKNRIIWNFFFAYGVVNGLVYLDLLEIFIMPIRIWKKMVPIAYCCRWKLCPLICLRCSSGLLVSKVYMAMDWDRLLYHLATLFYWPYTNLFIFLAALNGWHNSGRKIE